MNTVTRMTLSDGFAGTDETINEMAKAAMGKFGAGSPKIRNLTIDVIRAAGVPEKDKRGETEAVHNFVMEHLRYVNDPFGTEFITYPETLAFDRNDGDCDDHAILEAAMLGSIGIPTRFIAVGFKGKPYSHVYLGAELGGELLPLDPIIKNQAAGWEAPNPSIRKVFPVNTPSGVYLGSIDSAGKNLGVSILIALLILAGFRKRERRN